MMLRKFYGSSIQQARANARDVLGPGFIVVETKEAINEGRAWIHVMDDNRSQASKNKTGFKSSDLLPKAFDKIKETVNDSLQLFNTNGNRETHTQKAKPKSQAPSRRPNPAKYDRSSILSRPNHIPEFSMEAGQQSTANEAQLAQKLDRLTERFNRLEKLIGSQTMGMNVQTISHPAFQQLLASGVPHPIISRWFNELINEGIDPYDQQSSFMGMLAGKIKATLDIAATSAPARYMVFSGAPGSGKSSIIMKLATDSSLLNGNSCALVTIADSKSNSWFSPLSAFAYEHEIPHYKIEEKKQLKQLEEEQHNTDHILIEMPQESGVLTIKDIEHSIDASDTTEVHCVVNGAMNEAYLNHSQSKIAPDYIDLTHLDQVPRKGCLLPLMQQSTAKIRYVTNNQHIPGGISRFEPAGFAKQLLTL